MAEYTYKDVIIDPEDPRIEIGAEYYFGDTPNKVLSAANCGIQFGTLRDVKKDESSPFWIENRVISWAVLIRKKEPEKRYVSFDLSKPEVRDKLRGKWIKNMGDESQISGFHKINNEFWAACITSGFITDEMLMKNWVFPLKSKRFWPAW